MRCLCIFVLSATLDGIAAKGADEPGAVPSTMKAMQTSGWPCSGPKWGCLAMNANVPVPTPASGQVLVKMYGSSVNPKDVECVEPICLLFWLRKDIPFRCSKGTLGGDSILGGDGSGVVAATGEGCSGVKVGDEVWGFFLSAYAEYALAPCNLVRPKPKSLNFVDAGTIPGVGLTSLEVFSKAGAPWKRSDNVTVVVTAGQGGTGFMAIQTAKLLGAARVITAASGAGIEMVKSLGADVVIDYHKQEIFDVLTNNTVDVVFDNIGASGTADGAMHAIRPGGTFVLLTGGGKGTLSKQPKEGVKQIATGIFTPSGSGLDTLADAFDKGLLRPHTFQTYGLSEVPQAFSRSLAHGVFGKIAVAPNNVTGIARASEESALII